jgi:hypothetical protein
MSSTSTLPVDALWSGSGVIWVSAIDARIAATVHCATLIRGGVGAGDRSTLGMHSKGMFTPLLPNNLDKVSTANSNEQVAVQRIQVAKPKDLGNNYPTLQATKYSPSRTTWEES